MNVIKVIASFLTLVCKEQNTNGMELTIFHRCDSSQKKMAISPIVKKFMLFKYFIKYRIAGYFRRVFISKKSLSSKINSL